MGFIRTESQTGKVMERFLIRGPLSERGEGEEEHEDGRDYPRGRVSNKDERTAYCVRLNSNPSYSVVRLAEDLTPVTAKVALALHRRHVGDPRAALPGEHAPRPPPRCGRPY